MTMTSRISTAAHTPTNRLACRRGGEWRRRWACTVELRWLVHVHVHESALRWGEVGMGAMHEWMVVHMHIRRSLPVAISTHPRPATANPLALTLTDMRHRHRHMPGRCLQLTLRSLRSVTRSQSGRSKASSRRWLGYAIA